MRKDNSITINFMFNFLKTFSSILFPVVTFTYSSRILGVDGVGKVNFAKSIISYFSMFATLGMNYYGTREAAKLRDNRHKLSKFTHEVLLINGSTTVISYVALLIAMLYISRLKDYTLLLVVNSFSIFMMGMGMEWLYQALEEYKYIALRAMAFQGVALIIMMVTVKSAEDIVNYAIVSVLASSGSYIFNFSNSRKYIEFHWYGNYEIKKHLQSLVWLFALAISIELYTVLDSTMLGFLKGDFAVGRYTAAIRINKIVNTLITSLGVVLIPRLSYYIGRGEEEHFKLLIDKAYNFVFMFSVPACLGLFVLSDEIILLFCGSDFETAGFTMRLLVPIVLVIPFSVVTNQQTFVPMGKEKLILISTCAGAVTNFVFNFLLIPLYSENGAAVATVMAESVVAIICFINARRNLGIRAVFYQYYQYWIAGLPILALGVWVSKLKLGTVVTILITVALSAISYFSILLFMKNKYLIEIFKIIEKKMKFVMRRKKCTKNHTL